MRSSEISFGWHQQRWQCVASIVSFFGCCDRWITSGAVLISPSTNHLMHFKFAQQWNQLWQFIGRHNLLEPVNSRPASNGRDTDDLIAIPRAKQCSAISVDPKSFDRTLSPKSIKTKTLEPEWSWPAFSSHLSILRRDMEPIRNHLDAPSCRAIHRRGHGRLHSKNQRTKNKAINP